MHQGSDRLRGEALIEGVQAVDVVLTSYALVRRDGDALRQIDWFAVALDEEKASLRLRSGQASDASRLNPFALKNAHALFPFCLHLDWAKTFTKPNLNQFASKVQSSMEVALPPAAGFEVAKGVGAGAKVTGTAVQLHVYFF